MPTYLQEAGVRVWVSRFRTYKPVPSQEQLRMQTHDNSAIGRRQTRVQHGAKGSH